MTDTSKNKIYIDHMWGLFTGRFDDNVLHKHYALQISMASRGSFEITDENHKQTSYETCFINSNVQHRFKSEEACLILLINPISRIGHQLYHKYNNAKIICLEEDLKELHGIFRDYAGSNLTFADLVKSTRKYLEHYTCTDYLADKRIYNAIQYLEQNFDRIVSLEEISGFSCLSETRFLHLFKEKTNLNFRRYQLWNKLIKSLPYLQTHSITETAHECGFSDSSHYSRTFKETFGLSPKFLLPLK